MQIWVFWQVSDTQVTVKACGPLDKVTSDFFFTINCAVWINATSIINVVQTPVVENYTKVFKATIKYVPLTKFEYSDHDN